MSEVSSRPARPLRRALVVALTGMLVVLLGPLAGRADAHAVLVATSPTADSVVDDPPTTITIEFNEPVSIVGAGLRVFRPDGRRVDRGRSEVVDRTKVVVELDQAALRGTYTVAWRVLSQDGHDISGAWLYHHQVRTGAVDVDDGSSLLRDLAAAVVRWATFAGLMVAVGCAAFASMVRTAEGRQRLRRLVLAGTAVAGAGSAALLVFLTANAAGRSLTGSLPLVWEVSTSTHTGQVGIARVGVLLVGVVAAWAWRSRPGVAGLVAIAALPFVAAGSHAWTGGDRLTSTVADTVHQLAAGVWIGGIAVLLVLWSTPERHEVLLRRFSDLAVASVAALALSGAVGAWNQSGSVGALTGSDHGRLLLVKVVGLAALVYLGYLNRQRLLPALGSAADALSSLRSNLRIELAVGALVLAATAVVVNLPPGRSQYAAPSSVTVTADDLVIQGVVDPGRPGTNDLHLYFFGSDGVSAAGVDAVEVSAATGDIPPRKLTTVLVSPNHLIAYGASLPSSGTWTFTASIVRAGVPTTATFEVKLR